MGVLGRSEHSSHFSELSELGRFLNVSSVILYPYRVPPKCSLGFLRRVERFWTCSRFGAFSTVRYSQSSGCARVL